MAASCDVPRPGSCSSTPCKIVEGFVQGLVHAARVFARQNLLPPGLEGLHRHAAGISRDIERPAQMLSRMTKTNPQAVMATDFVIERAHITELLGQSGHRFRSTPIETPADLAGQPG